MAINLKFDLTGNPEPPSIVLANRNGNKLGQLNVNVDSIDVSDKFNAASEFSFTLNKYIDAEPTPLWDKVVDFKLVYCPEWDLWFEIKVELDETTETVKTVFCTQLGQAELSQIKVYNIHINEEGDPNWDTNNETYKSTILYDKEHTDISLLHRLLKDKAPHYSIAYVDESIQRIQKSFSFDDTSICDAFDEISEEIGCLFVYNSNSTKGGKPNRTISVYDLQQNCKDCGHRGEFTDKCPKCGSINIKYGYGEDTTIFVTSDELATEGIQLVTDVDSVKNCFKLEGGDDLMTATIRNCNPNGSDYIWYFSDALKEDMSDELVEKLESYDKKYKECYDNHTSALNSNLAAQYNALVEKYDDYYNTKSTCLNCNNEDYFYEQCPNCNGTNILVGKKLQTIDTTITGYSDLMTAYYNTIDLALYLKSGLMPTLDIESNKTTAEKQVELLINPTLSPVAVNVKEVKNITETTAKSAVLSMAKVLVKSTYKVDVVDGSSSLDETVYIDDAIGEYKKWTGKFVVTNYSDEEDSATSEIIEVFVGNDAKTFVEQKIKKALNKENTDDYSVIGLFAKEYDEFCEEIKKYALNPLDNFSKACDAVISILAEQGVGDDGSNEDNEIDKATKKALYDALYNPYFEKQQAINKEIAIRESEIAIIEGVWDKSDENNPRCTTDGLQQCIERCQQDIQAALDFEKHLGEDLWLEFCAYRREDNYSNSNYVSDGLNNAELFNRALEFIEVAEAEIFKSAELQHSISATLNNLLPLPKFKPLLKSFKTGNWIRVQVDDKVYKLRLLEYGFGYGDSESISVEFSDVNKIKNGVTDVKEVLEQASSMASSYDSVQRQAEKGNVARSTIDQWIVDGLNSADVQITSNDSEEIILTKSGLLARSYDDITGTYLPEQFKLTHNIMAYTDDGWKTISSALGKHNYKKWNGSSFVDDEGYGLTSKFVTAGYITGSQIIGGEILSSNYQVGGSGTYLNLIKGDFDFAGGKIVYNADKNRVTLSGVEIQWDSVNTPTIENIDGLSSITEDIRIIEQGLQATTINGQYVISPHIVGGDLKIIGDNGSSAQISNDGALTATGANITGDITATSLTLGNGVKISTENIDGIDEYAKIGDIEGVPDNIITTDDIAISESTTTNGVTTQKITVGDTEYTNIISGDFVFTDIGLGTDTTDGSERYTCISKDGLLTAKNAIVYGTIYATAGEFTGSIKAGSTLYVGEHTDEDGNVYYNTWIDTDGVLHTNEAHINGTITAIDGMIGGFNIEPTIIEEGVVKAGGTLWSGELQEGQTSVQIGDNKSIFLSATDMEGTMPFYSKVERKDEDGNTIFDENDEAVYDITQSDLEMEDWRITVGTNFGVTSDGTAYMSNAEIVGGSLRMGTASDGYHTWISSDGVLNANGVNISGEMHVSDKSTIAGWNIDENRIYKDDTIINSGDTNMSSNSLISTNSSPVRFSAGGDIEIIEYEYIDGSDSTGSGILSTGINEITVNCDGGELISVNITRAYAEWDDDGSTSEIDWTLISINSTNNTFIIDLQYDSYTPDRETLYVYYTYTYKVSQTNFTPAFQVLKDGSLYAGAANITGTIRATDGEIGGLKIDNGIKGYVGNTESLSLTSDGLIINNSLAKIQVGNFATYYDKNAGNTYWQTNGALYIQGMESERAITSIELMTDRTEGAETINVFYNLVYSNSHNSSIQDVFELTFYTNDKIIHPVHYTVPYKTYYQFGDNSPDEIGAGSGSLNFTLDTRTKQTVCSINIGAIAMGISIQQPDGTWSDIITSNVSAVSFDTITQYYANNNIKIMGNLIPKTESVYSLGSTDNEWHTVYAQTGTIQRSDKNQKNTIEDISMEYVNIFDALKPVSYKFNNSTSSRTHLGFVAQDVRDAIYSAGLTTQDFAAYCEWEKDDGTSSCGLRYEEFIALCVNEIQKLKKRVAELENK